MKTTMTASMTTKELKAVAIHQDITDIRVSEIAELLGAKIKIPELSRLAKLRILLGGTHTISDTVTDIGSTFQYTINIDKNGIKISIDIDMDEDIFVARVQLASAILGIYLPVVTSTITSTIAANKAVKELLN